MSEKYKVLSFDVGIKNLAYCLIEFDIVNNTFDIIKWDVINLADNRHICSHVKRDGHICQHIATRKIKLNNDNISYYCKNHIHKAILTVMPVNVIWTKIQLDELHKCTMCKRDACYMCNVIEGYYCNIHYKTISNRNGFVCTAKKCKNMINKGLYIAKNEVDEFGNKDNERHYTMSHGWCDEHFDSEYKTYIKKKTGVFSQNCNKISLNL